MLSKPCAGKKSVEMIDICETSADHELIICFEHSVGSFIHLIMQSK